MTPDGIQLYNSSGCTSTGGKVPGEQRKRVPEQLVPHPLLYSISHLVVVVVVVVVIAGA